jgi:hypothetical protein
MARHLQEAPFKRQGWEKVEENELDCGLIHYLYEISPGRQKIIDESMNGAVPIFKITTLRFYQVKGSRSYQASLKYLHKLPNGKYALVMEFYNATAIALVKKLRDCKK